MRRGISLDAPPRSISSLLWARTMLWRVECVMGLLFSLPAPAVPQMAAVDDALLTAIFPFIGALIFIVGVRNGLRALRLLRHGRLGWGKPLAVPPKNISVRPRVVTRFFAFVDDKGRERVAVCYPNKLALVQDQPEEPLLYDDDDAILLDELSGAPRIVEGKFVVRGNVAVIGALTTAAVAVALLAATVYSATFVR